MTARESRNVARPSSANTTAPNPPVTSVYPEMRPRDRSTTDDTASSASIPAPNAATEETCSAGAASRTAASASSREPNRRVTHPDAGSLGTPKMRPAVTGAMSDTAPTQNRATPRMVRGEKVMPTRSSVRCRFVHPKRTQNAAKYCQSTPCPLANRGRCRSQVRIAPCADDPGRACGLVLSGQQVVRAFE